MPLTGPLIFLLVPFSILLLPLLPIEGALALYALITGQSMDGILGKIFDPILLPIINFMSGLSPDAGEWLDKLFGWFK
ncbi:MAG: hypothetical protein FWF60_00145 [Oscillospiraceae bacterium]|nr:hypothetical protein [Oscillospiraceae bacterium]